MKVSVIPVCFLFLASAAFSLPSEAQADVTLPKVIGSHMVLQRDRPLPIWGWAAPDEEVVVKIDGATATAKADAQGKWMVKLPAMKAVGKAHAMTIRGKNTIELEDILIGDVWIGSGQSNMEFHLASSTGGQAAVAAANCPQIRLMHVEKVQSPQPAKDVVVVGEAKPKKGQPVAAVAAAAAWKVCTPQSAPGFSAVLYYFGHRLQKELDVPVGLIDSSWGGSPIEAWIAADGKSGGMYNGMIAPLAPFAIRGTIWYQGETNVMQKNGLAYADKMKALIGGWRQKWGYDSPFYFVQIAPWAGRYEAGQLPALWEAQVACLKIPSTGMAVTTDLVDDLNDIHPKKKLEVGNRLALWALAKEFGKADTVYSGPLFKSMKIEGDKIRVSFAHVAGGLKSRDGKPLSEFEVAAADGKFVAAEAVIDGDTIVVQAKGVTTPAQARFGWRNVANPNLINQAGLPASPFKTENWQGGTGE